MSITKLELARSDCEAIETCEKVLAMALQQKKRIEQAREGKDASFAV
jgi:predicted metal-dependent hydrolase